MDSPTDLPEDFYKVCVEYEYYKRTSQNDALERLKKARDGYEERTKDVEQPGPGVKTRQTSQESSESGSDGSKRTASSEELDPNLFPESQSPQPIKEGSADHVPRRSSEEQEDIKNFRMEGGDKAGLRLANIDGYISTVENKKDQVVDNAIFGPLQKVEAIQDEPIFPTLERVSSQYEELAGDEVMKLIYREKLELDEVLTLFSIHRNSSAVVLELADFVKLPPIKSLKITFDHWRIQIEISTTTETKVMRYWSCEEGCLKWNGDTVVSIPNFDYEQLAALEVYWLFRKENLKLELLEFDIVPTSGEDPLALDLCSFYQNLEGTSEQFERYVEVQIFIIKTWSAIRPNPETFLIQKMEPETLELFKIRVWNGNEPLGFDQNVLKSPQWEGLKELDIQDEWIQRPDWTDLSWAPELKIMSFTRTDIVEIVETFDRWLPTPPLITITVGNGFNLKEITNQYRQHRLVNQENNKFVCGEYYVHVTFEPNQVKIQLESAV